MSRAADLFDQIVGGGVDHVQGMIDSQYTEELFLDYKRSANDGNSDKLDQIDRNNLSKCASGFGNSEGDVIVWGVDCRNLPGRGDVPKAAQPIIKPVRFKSLLEQITSGVTLPPHAEVRHQALSDPDQASGFVVTLIPAGMHAPYQATFDTAYYIRSGSNFAKAPHGVLAGLFGRRPSPLVQIAVELRHVGLVGFNNENIGLNIHSRLTNAGRGIAEDVWLNIEYSLPGEASKIELDQSDANNIWEYTIATKTSLYRMAKRGFRLAPGAWIDLWSGRVLLQPPYSGNFGLTVSAGATSSVPRVVTLQADRNELANADAAFRNSTKGADFTGAFTLIGT
jgi:hypothetical protein